MRPANEWFTPERLTAYYYTHVALFLAIALAAVGAPLVAVGLDSEIPTWVLAVVGGLFVLVFGYLAWWVPAFYDTAAYRFTDEAVEYRRGVFFQQHTTVPYNRVTNVNVQQGPVERVVGSGSVGIHTAGYGGQSGAELTVNGVEDYAAIGDQLLEAVRGKRPVSVESGAADPADVPQSDVNAELLAEVRRIRAAVESEGR